MDWIETIRDFGFPIALSIYLIYRDTKDKQSLVKRVELLENQRFETEEKRTNHLAEVVSNNAVALNNISTVLRTKPCLSKEPNPTGI